jgi:8-amino-7-oxononanoate synthase
MDDDLVDWRRQGLFRTRRRLQSRQGARVFINGRELVNFASNDYLNLAGDPRLALVAARAARRFGCGAGASPLVSGYLPPLRSLEKDLAQWEDAPVAVVFGSGFLANLAVVGSLAGLDDALFSDELNHASLIDGCRLSHARVHVYRHGDANQLHDLLRTHGPLAGRRLIVTDTVFSMDGDLAPLADLHDLAHRHDALLVVDEAHATGVLGAHGRGVTELVWPGRTPVEVIKVGTLSKALGTQGGFACGPRPLGAWLVNRARPYIYSTALAPPIAAAARRAVRLVAAEPQRRQRLQGLAGFLRDRLREHGYAVARSPAPIIPVIVGSPQAAIAASARLQESGFLVPAIRPPSVPANTARLRISITAGHTEEEVTRLVESLRSL